MQTQPNLLKAVAGGVAGTAVMTMMMYVGRPMMGLNMDIAAMLGSMLGNSWTAGMAMHVFNGAVIFPLIFALVIYEHLPGSPVIRGTIWGVALWLIAQAVVMPMMGAGFFSSNMGGMMAAGASLMGHAIYGALLGALAGAPESRVAKA